MKKIVFITSFIFLVSISLSADQIYLKDSTIINCKIIQVTNTRVEYDPEGDIPFLTIGKDKVVKIVYDNGNTVQMAEQKAEDESAPDRIYLSDATVISCKIIQILPTVIECDPAGAIPFLTISTREINKVECSDGLAVQFDRTNTSDKLLLKSGETIERVLKKITTSAVVYINKKTGKEETADRAGLSNIIIHVPYDKAVSQINQAAEAEKPEEEKQEEISNKIGKIREGGFIDSVIRVAFIAGWCDTSDSIETKEKNATKSNDHQNRDSEDLDTDGDFYGLDADLMLPSIKFIQRRGFDLTGVKFGVKLMYLKYKIDEDVEYSSDDALFGYYTGKLLEYNSANAGPEMNVIFSPRNDYFNIVLQLFVTGGYIHQGKLTAVPGLRDAGLAFERSQYYTEFTGYTINWGAGVNFVFNRIIPFTVGINVKFGYSKIEFDKKLPIYNNSKSTDFNDGGMNFSAGVHF